MENAVVAGLFREYQALDGLRLFAVAALPLLFAITVHEVAHGWVARLRGDRTAEMLGRLTLNPVKHIDPIGTVLVPGVMLLTTGFIFGWAKPVPVTIENLKGRNKDMAVVGAAGPLSNAAMALGWMLVMIVAKLLYGIAPGPASFLFMMGIAGIVFNLILGVLNMLPIPPLDGGRVVSALLPGRLSWQFDRIEPFGIFILLGLLVFGGLWPLIGGVVTTLSNLLFSAVV